MPAKRFLGENSTLGRLGRLGNLAGLAGLKNHIIFDDATGIPNNFPMTSRNIRPRFQKILSEKLIFELEKARLEPVHFPDAGLEPDGAIRLLWANRGKWPL